MKYIAHRGYSIESRDNSLQAIKDAIWRKYYGVEIDIQLCKTGEIVLFHDIYVNDSFICDLTVDELKDLGIITLCDVYLQVPNIQNTKIFLDIKGNNTEIVKKLEEFYRHKDHSNVYFCSFNRQLLRLLDTKFKKGSTFETIFNPDELDMITNGMSVVFVHWTCLCSSLVEHCKRGGVEVFTYTHKDRMEIEYMMKFDVDGIITNEIRF
jgi:glycerophosphoryl diester phosphodiesterase